MKLTAKLAVIASASALLMLACSSPASEEPPAPANAATTSTDPTETPAPASPAASAAPPPAASTPSGGASCAAAATDDACWKCCEDKVPAYVAKEAEIAKQYQACVCEPSRCADVCKIDYCASTAADPEPKEGSACEECFYSETTIACDDAQEKALEALWASAMAGEVDACGAASKCDDKYVAGPGDEDEDVEEIGEEKE